MINSLGMKKIIKKISSYKICPLALPAIVGQWIPLGVPVPRDNQIVSFCLFVGIWKAQDESYLLVLYFKVKPRSFTILKSIYVVNIVLYQLQAEPFIKDIYTTYYSKYIGSTLVRTNFKVP